MKYYNYLKSNNEPMTIKYYDKLVENLSLRA